MSKSIPDPVAFTNGIRSARAFGYAGYTLLIWDFFLTIQDEVQYIWPSAWTSVKVIFLCNRYINIISMGITNVQQAGRLVGSDSSSCFGYALFQTIFALLSFASIHVLVLLRAWSLWGSRFDNAAILLLALFIIYTSVVLSLLVYGEIIARNNPNVLPEVFRTCITVIPDYLWTIWLPSVALEAIVFAMTIISLHRYSKDQHSSFRSPLVKMLYRDAIAYFVASMFCSSWNITTWVLYKNDPRNLLANVFGLCIVNIAGQRLVLDLREIDTRSRHLSTGRIGKIIDNRLGGFVSSEIRFANPSYIGDVGEAEENELTMFGPRPEETT